MPNSSQRASSSRHSALAQLNKVLDDWPMGRHDGAGDGGNSVVAISWQEIFSHGEEHLQERTASIPAYLMTKGRVADCWSPYHNDLCIGCLGDPVSPHKRDEDAVLLWGEKRCEVVEPEGAWATTLHAAKKRK